MIRYLQSWVKRKQRDFLPGTSMEARLARGVLWSLAGMAVTQALGMLASVVTARLLGKVGLGQLGMINSTIGTFGTFAGLGLGLTVTRHVAELRTSDPERAGRILGLSNQLAGISGGLVSLILFLIAPMLAARTLNAPHLADDLRLASVALFLGSLNGAQIGGLTGLEAFDAIAGLSLFRGLLNFPVLIAGVWFFGLPGAVMARVVSSALGWWLNRAALRRESAKSDIAITYDGTRAEVPLLWKFAIPAFLASLVASPTMWIANSILVNQPGGYGGLGLLAAANHWRALLRLLPTVLVTVALPVMSSQAGAKAANGAFGRILEMTQSLVILGVVPAATLLMFLSRFIMALYGKTFVGATLVPIGVMSGLMVSSLGSAVGSAIQAQGRMWLGFSVNLSWGLGVVLFVWLLAPRWGAEAIAFGSAISYSLATVWVFIYLSRELSVGFVRRIFGGLGFIALLTGLCVMLPPRFRPYVGIPMFAVSLCVTVFVLIDPATRRTIARVARTLPRRRPPGSR